jgi:hypothetical protein
LKDYLGMPMMFKDPSLFLMMSALACAWPA